VIEAGPPVSGFYGVLIWPGKPLATEKVFAGYKGAFSSAARHVHAFESQDAGIQFLRKAANDLEGAAITIIPEIASALKALTAEKSCELARLTGSGSACFGLFKSQQAAQEAATRLVAQYPHWWVQATAFR
jgi:4-diphosphocytidyl-2-C-methyl-D-erythritol kinase